VKGEWQRVRDVHGDITYINTALCARIERLDSIMRGARHVYEVHVAGRRIGTRTTLTVAKHMATLAARIGGTP
jgi:SH3-like domain-containing protein